ncbi:hypothetical protein GCM10022288_08530 [Gryllotalpicola kribbensis]|uniref:Alpha/beta hydrolase n=1 Tax=Gryllotalpicola kribbensis TaxID=993084 RepID=A0ABP8ALC4_9MICO
MSLPRHRVWLVLALAAAVCAATLGMLAWPGHVAEAAGPIAFRLSSPADHALRPDALNLAESSPGNAPLLVFLPATGAVPRSYTRFLDTAHGAGFSVLGLDYHNIGPSLAHSCEADLACYGDMLANRYDGSHPTRFSRVAPGGAIVDRLDDSLAYLCAHDPAGRWQRYLRGSEVRWNRLVLAGHSQGGGEAEYIAHRHAVRGVLMFSAPAEAMGGAAAGWLSGPSATPASRVWALDDVHDVYAARILPSWRALGIRPAAPARLPTGAHGLRTTLPLGTPGQAHDRVISDATPLGPDRRPVLEPVWRWMLARVAATTA